MYVGRILISFLLFKFALSLYVPTSESPLFRIIYLSFTLLCS